MDSWTPELTCTELLSGCRLSLVGVTYGIGETLLDAARDLIARVTAIALQVRTSGLQFASAFAPPDSRVMSYLWQVGEAALRGEDIRGLVLGSPVDADTAA